MSRDYARIMTSIWQNREFCALCERDQRMFLLLVTQPDISAAGVLRVSLEWWANMAPDTQPNDVAESLLRLQSGRFLLVDRMTGEVLIRSFIRWDAGFNNPKRRPVIIRAAEDVRSPQLMETLAAEFRRVSLPPLHVECLPDREPGSDGLHEAGATGGASSRNGNACDFPQVEWLPGSEPGSEPGTRMGSTSVSSGDTATRNPGTGNPPPAERDAADAATEDDDLFERFWVIYPRKQKKVDARKAWKTALRRRVAPDIVIKAAAAHAQAWRDNGKEIEYVPYPATWLRSGAYDDEPERPSTGPGPPRRAGQRTRDDKRAAVGSVVAEVFGTSALQPDLRALQGGRP